jgi:glycosyltransferase involved in cell wall biosynthesis
MNERLVSVVIPVFNRHDYAIRAIESVLNQIYENWELFVIDDKSDDEFLLPEICMLYERKILVVRNDKNLGPGLSRQVGLNLANGRYVAFLDSDDFWDPEFLKASIGTLESYPSFAASYCQSMMIDGSLRRRNNIHEAVSDIFFGVVSGFRPWATCALLWRRQFTGNWNSIRTNQDALFELESAIINEKIIFIPKVLCTIDKTTGFNAEDIVGRQKSNVNRTRVLFKGAAMLKEYKGDMRNQIESSLWSSLYYQLRKMLSQGEFLLCTEIVIFLIVRFRWRKRG